MRVIVMKKTKKMTKSTTITMSRRIKSRAKRDEAGEKRTRKT